jgi:hypothetical protein
LDKSKPLMPYGRSALEDFASVYEAKRTHDGARAKVYRALSAWARDQESLESLRPLFSEYEESLHGLWKALERTGDRPVTRRDASSNRDDEAVDSGSLRRRSS